MQISPDLAETLARFAYVQTHQAERVRRYGWHPGG
jgi:hypothetical protein